MQEIQLTFDVHQLRRRLQKMTDNELREFGRACIMPLAYPRPHERKSTSPLFLFCRLLCSRFVPFLYLTPAAQAVPAFWSDL